MQNHFSTKDYRWAFKDSKLSKCDFFLDLYNAEIAIFQSNFVVPFLKKKKKKKEMKKKDIYYSKAMQYITCKSTE